MIKERKLLVHALDRLKHINFEDDHLTNDLIQTIQKYLAQPEQTEQEPVAWYWEDFDLDDPEWIAMADTGDKPIEHRLRRNIQPLYLAPPKRRPLTDEEIYSIGNKYAFHAAVREIVSDEEIVKLWANKSPANEFECVRLVEQAHGIGGGE